MDHTAGFEDRIIGTAARTAEDVPPLGDFLAEQHAGPDPAARRDLRLLQLRRRARRLHRGRVSGEPYEDYVQQPPARPARHGAQHRGRAGAGRALAGDLARSYDSDTTPPARSRSRSTRCRRTARSAPPPTDMASFMIAHLRRRRRASSPPQTATLMHERSFAADPRLGGYAHGFMDRTINGHRVLMHDGSWEGFQSALVLVPDCDLGLFLSTNGTGGIETVAERDARVLRPVRARPSRHREPARPSSSCDRTAGRLLQADPAQRVDRGEADLAARPVPAHGRRRRRRALQGQDWTPASRRPVRPPTAPTTWSSSTAPDGRRYVATDGPPTS